MNYYKALGRQFSEFQSLFNKGLREIRKKEELEEHAQTMKEETTREENGSPEYPNGDMAEPYDIGGDR